MFEGSTTAFLSRSFVSALVAAAAFLLLVPAARSDDPPLAWTSPTPADQSTFTVAVNKEITLKLTAATNVPFAAVHIAAVQPIPSGARLNTSDGGIARATFRWKPAKTGTYTLEFAASSLETALPNLRYVIKVKQRSYSLANSRTANWALVLRKTVVRAQPSQSSRAVTTLSTKTGEGTHNLVLALEGLDKSSKETWYRVRLSILPNNSTGWVRRGDLGAFHLVRTRLVVNRSVFAATLYRAGKKIFRAPVGVGQPNWPTPRGEYYIRMKLCCYGNPTYGPYAFGLSARSAVLTDWPGGGYIGIHGTNAPGLIPGRISHGCIRMRNGDVTRLNRLMPAGTPVTVL